MKGSTKIERERKTLFRRAWYAYHNNKSDVGYAENRIGKSHGCHFPRSFSRYSTLESDRGNVEAAARDLLSKESSGGEGEGKGGKAAAHTSDVPASPKTGGPITTIRYLVLCRVAVGKVFVTSKEYKGFPAVGSDPAFDSMYNPLQEEYLVLRPEQVLPEFIIQYVFKKLPSSTISAKLAGTSDSSLSSSPSSSSLAGNAAASLPLMPIDLSTPHLNLGPNDNPWQVDVASQSSKPSSSSPREYPCWWIHCQRGARTERAASQPRFGTQTRARAPEQRKHRRQHRCCPQRLRPSGDAPNSRLHGNS